jgi:MarR family transcriptional regulator, organic hydroperoxide resistance regulator
MGTSLKNRLRMSKFESPAQEAILALMVAASELRANTDRVLSEFNLTGEQFNILRILRGAGEEGHPSGEIGCRMIDRSPDITRRLDAMEGQGLVTRERSVADRRVVQVRITQKGLALLQTIAPKMHDYEDKLTHSLSEKDMFALTEICEKLIESDRD